MTGLLVQHGKFNYVYYDFSKYNYEKIKTIINAYKDYSFKTFNSQDEYYNYLSNIDIPWENNETIRNRIVRTKAEVLNITLNDTMTLEEKEIYLDRIFYNQALAKAVAKYDYDLILNELLILSGSVKGESKFHDIPEPLRLEYLLALSIGKKYGLKRGKEGSQTKHLSTAEFKANKIIEEAEEMRQETLSHKQALDEAKDGKIARGKKELKGQVVAVTAENKELTKRLDVAMGETLQMAKENKVLQERNDRLSKYLLVISRLQKEHPELYEELKKPKEKPKPFNSRFNSNYK